MEKWATRSVAWMGGGSGQRLKIRFGLNAIAFTEHPRVAKKTWLGECNCIPSSVVFNIAALGWRSSWEADGKWATRSVAWMGGGSGQRPKIRFGLNAIAFTEHPRVVKNLGSVNAIAFTEHPRVPSEIARTLSCGAA